jgi:hypothetical protein
MFKRSAFVLSCLLLLQIAAIAQQPSVETQPSPSPAPTPSGVVQQSAEKVSYEALLERVKQQDPTVSFTDLRLAYTETKQYSPYSGSIETRNAMIAAVSNDENEKALALSEKILAGNYLDIYGHLGASAANKHLGRPKESDYHRYVYVSLLKSIYASGDGKTMETAFVVISTDEEYAFFQYIGVRFVSQALIDEKGHRYDKMTAKDPKTGQSGIYYFNIDKPFDWLRNRFKD